ncbi:hypothetical protein HZA39_03585 [Candidatus Peregrinibacteria bacterium]|nr:hypothetical protein [Candidatus Peregrinibacteria bacterium]
MHIEINENEESDKTGDDPGSLECDVNFPLTETTLAQTSHNPEKQKSLSTAIGHFVIDEGFFRFLKNGADYEGLYKEFRKVHLNINISYEDFKNHVIETAKRTADAIVSETITAITAIVSCAVRKICSLPVWLAGPLPVSSSLLSNFTAFAITWGTSHNSEFRKSDGSFDKARFAKTLVREYGRHFGPIVIGADIAEGMILQILANNKVDNIAISSLVILFFSFLAVVVYFGEQQIREKVWNTFTAKFTPFSFEVGRFFI